MIKHAINPSIDRNEKKLKTAESDFEKQVIHTLLNKGYKVFPQWKIGEYRIDMVVEDGKINCVITKDLSRLGRNYIQTGLYTDYFFPENKIRYIAINDNYDSEKGDNELAPFRNVMNEIVTYRRVNIKSQNISSQAIR